MNDQPIDATAEELPPGDPADGPPPDTPAPSTAIVQTRRHEVLRPLDVTQQREAMQLYQQGLQSILDPSDWQDAGRGEKFVKKSGWRKIAAWFDLSIEFVRDVVERDDAGAPQRAQVVARAIAASGRYADGDGYCDVSETRFRKESARQKLENDLRGTATTRAVNRAVSNLVGMGAVSAEEVDGPAGQSWGPATSDDDAVRFQRALAWLADCSNVDPDSLVADVFARFVKDFGYGPQAGTKAVMHVAAALKAAMEQAASAATTPQEDTPHGDH